MNQDDNRIDIPLGQINLKGWPAVLVIALLAPVAIFLGVWERSLPPAAAEAALPYLQIRYGQEYQQQLEADRLAGRRIDEELARKWMDSQNVEITSIKGRGWGSEVIAKIEYTVDGGPPPDGGSPAYMYLNHSSITGWSFKRDAISWNYRANFF